MPNAGWFREDNQAILMCVNIAVAANEDGRLEIYTYDNGSMCVFHKWQVRPSGAWSNWSSFDFVPNQYTYQNNFLSGNTDLFAGLAGDHCLGAITMGSWGEAQMFPNNGWGPWSRLQNNNTPDSLLLTALARWRDGQLYAFGVDGTQQNILYSYQEGVGARASWNNWYNFGPPTNIEGLYAVRSDDWPFRSAFPLVPGQTQAVGANRDGRIEIFGASAHLWHQWQTDVNSQTKWSGWQSLGTPPPLLDDIAGLAVIQNADGRLEVFAAGQDAQFWHRWQNQSTGWSHPWSPLPGLPVTYWKPGEQGHIALKATFRTARDSDGCIELFAIGPDGGVYIMKQLQANGGWADGWEPLGGEQITAFDVAQNKDGRLEVFIVSDGSVWHRWQIEPGRNGTWGP